MADRKSVITHLKIIHTWASFARERDLQFFTEKHLEDITQWTDDALELLKGQESVEPEIEVLNEIERIHRCPRCHKPFFYAKQKFCDQCGQAVKWE